MSHYEMFAAVGFGFLVALALVAAAFLLWGLTFAGNGVADQLGRAAERRRARAEGRHREPEEPTAPHHLPGDGEIRVERDDDGGWRR